jgi:hypothetical protein
VSNVLTGHEAMRQRALSEGFLAAFLKPAPIEELVRLIGNHCPSSRAGESAGA